MNTHGNPAGSDWRHVPLFAILLFQCAALIARSYLQVVLRERGVDLHFAADLSFLVVPPILLVLMYPVLAQHGHLLLALFPRDGLNFRIVVIGILLGVSLRLAFWGGVISTTAFGINVMGDDAIAFGPYLAWQCPPWWQLGLGVLVSAVMIPPIEEAICRGFFLHRLLHLGRPFATVVSSVLFAVYHIPETILLAFLIGIVFAIAMLNSGALWVPMIAHASYNFAAQIDWRCLNGRWNAPDLTPVLAGTGALALALMLIALLLATVLVSKRIIGPPGAAAR